MPPPFPNGDPDGQYCLCQAGTGTVPIQGQIVIVDQNAIITIADSYVPDGRGILIDFDGQSTDVNQPSKAAGWVASLSASGKFLFGIVQWSDEGAAAILGKRYGYITPLFGPSDLVPIDPITSSPKRFANPKSVSRFSLTNNPQPFSGQIMGPSGSLLNRWAGERSGSVFPGFSRATAKPIMNRWEANGRPEPRKRR